MLNNTKNMNFLTNKSVIEYSDEEDFDIRYESSELQILINVFFLPIVSFIGFLLNLLCAFVYLNILKTHPENKMYNYLVVNSISNSIAMLIDSFAPVALCGNSCNISHTYAAQVFYLYGFIYLADVFETFSSLIDIVITIDRYVTINNKMTFFKKISHRTIIASVFIFCFIYYIPFIAKKRISSIVQPLQHAALLQSLDSKFIRYITISSEFGKSLFGRYFIFAQLTVSEIFIMLVMICFNVRLACSLSRQNRLYSILTKRTSLSRRHEMTTYNDLRKKTKNDLKITLMVICLTVMTMLGNSPIVIVHTLTFFYEIDHMLVNNLLALTNLITVLSYALIIIVFYTFDNMFRHVLLMLIKGV